MNEQLRESLSALMDDEANELELERILVQADRDPEIRQTWARQNRIRDALTGNQVSHRELDISASVHAEIAGASGGGTADNSGFGQKLLRPLTSFAVAASVAATVVIGGQQLSQLGGANPYDSGTAIATTASPVGMVNSPGGTTVQASYGTQPLPVLLPATRTAYQELARQRMGKYMQEHAEHAALNSPQGLIAYARVPQIRE